MLYATPLFAYPTLTSAALRVQAVETVPQSLVRELEGNDSMRAKFEALCRKAQDEICKQIEELDGEGKVKPKDNRDSPLATMLYCRIDRELGGWD